jgi:hypothetical protein
VQVTEFRADEGTADPARSLRATEKRNAAQGKYPAYAIPLQHQIASLRLRVTEKIEKARRYDFKQFEEVWLLVAGALARTDAIVSTFIVAPKISAEELNRTLDEQLQPSKYGRAFIHIEVGDIVYEWTRDTRWRLIHCAAPEPEAQPTGELWFMQFFRDPAFIGDVPIPPTRIERECGECGGPFTREHPRREPERSDGRYVHTDQEYCAHLQRVTVRRMPGTD